MSQISTPVGAAFEFQRNAIEQTHDAVTRAVEAQREFGEAVVDFGPARQANERGYEALRTAVDGYFDAVEAATPGPDALFVDAREAVADGIETLEANQAEAVETVEANVREGTESVDELVDEFVAALDEYFEAVLETHEDVEAGTLEAIDDIETDLEELRAEFGDGLEDFESQVAAVQSQVEEATEDLVEAAEGGLETAGESLESIQGIGPTYAQRLQDEGIESFQALADASAEAIADVAEVTREQAEAWIEAAQSA